MKIYIASSWKNQHAVMMLTEILRLKGHKVLSFIENSHGEPGYKPFNKYGTPNDFGGWVRSDRGKRSFVFDTNGAIKSDLVIYISPSGTDAWAEVGAAWASKVPILGLWAKGEPAGLMRRMMTAWFTDYKDLLKYNGL